MGYSVVAASTFSVGVQPISIGAFASLTFAKLPALTGWPLVRVLEGDWDW